MSHTCRHISEAAQVRRQLSGAPELRASAAAPRPPPELRAATGRDARLRLSRAPT